MKIMFRVSSLLVGAILIASSAIAADTDELSAMLAQFLATSGEEAAHESFWADDLIYTSSAGLRFGKAEIMAGFEASDTGSNSTEEPPPLVYSGEEVDIRIFGDMAIVAFKLVGRPADTAAGGDVMYYFNTGTFLKRDGVWQAVAWQATIIPPT
ncbi:MAG: DUF4440 domain-containing protein [Gammaproteobacteria bacterium]|nr:DUF4440 domain-containing protein [Gammaproteobacteria bacterium]